ncbi:MAG TPA: RluA family pseudouridine synthase [Stellaceae bacterium]|nr:RluA family pseudouridine synthase [Stellaceae bacterium]
MPSAGTLRQVTAQAIEAGERLDRLLAAHLGELSRTRLKRLVEAGRVSLNGATITDPSMRVKPGQTFAVSLPPPVDDIPEPQALELVVRFEDEHVIVIDKPAGLVVHPAPGNPDRTLVNALLAHCGASLAGIGGVKRPGIVHRLDKDTSGLMVVAKSELAHVRLSADFAARRIDRAYHAIVCGVPVTAAGAIDAPIGRSPHNRKKMAVVERGGKAALTRYRVLRRFGTVAALVECRLATGRTHQIRVHLSARGHPLIGDRLYGGGRHATASAALARFPRQALHATVLGFVHPATAQPIRFESALPRDIEELIHFLEKL